MATSASEGAGKWTSDLDQWFEGRTVWILADNDEAGEAHALDVARHLHPVAASVSIVRLPGLPPKGDVSDWLDAGHKPRAVVDSIGDTLDPPSDLLGIAKATPKFDPAAAQPNVAPTAPAPNAIKATPFTWRDPSQFPRREWLLGHDYCRRYLSGLIAPGASGKSGLMLAEALVLVTGRPLLGTAPRETVKVWYYGGEDPQEETERRVLAAMKHYGIAPVEVDGRLFLTSGRDVPISIADMADGRAKVATPVVEAIVAQMVENEIGAMLVDPFVSTHGVGENDNVAINLVARQWGAIAERTNAAIGLAHHSSKPGGETVTTEKSRGASSLMDACRIGRAMNKMTKAQADELGVEEPNRFFRIGGADSAGKHNLAPPTDKTHWYRLASVCLENGKPAGGNAFQNMAPDLSDWVGVVETWEPPSLMSHVDNVAQLEEIQRRVGRGKFRESYNSAEWVGGVVADVLELDAMNKGHRARIRRLLAVWYASGALEIYEEKDDHREVKKYVRVGSGDDGCRSSAGVRQ
ncbi:AAA family ATPase [Chenggangzhangella methanolivorans]|uniref:AAA family ATPase n=1 Tax=Chenggangzhangella methanolivorans TaxID=1437009 RepID=A0A9E6R811_9HYPH|nr:AAA family ATPase [Chenggangzhangella methanolivorans]QZN98538.1 AAA family ATPase [Chenggangzhangella methanolivorans]